MRKVLAAISPGQTGIDRSRLFASKPSGRICERPALLASLDGALNRTLTLIVGPAGYGKTTLVAQWRDILVERRVAVAYYSASERDRDAPTFVRMIAYALDFAGADVAGSLALNSSDTAQARLLDDLLLRLELAGHPVVLVIDDFERVENAETITMLQALVNGLPACAHLVIASRRRPRIPLAGLDVQGRLHILDASRLRLSRQELAWVLDLSADSIEVADIALCTDGWPAAVQLYRLWRERQQGEHPPKFGAHIAEMTDYLTEQLFDSLPPQHQDLLVDIALVEEVQPGLADSIRGRSDSGCLLDDVAQSLSTMVRRSEGSDDPTYRLHPMMLDYLRARLAKDPKRLARLSAGAAIWYLEHQRYPDAVRFALDGHDPEIMHQIWLGLRPIHILLAHGAAMLRAILREIPDSVIAAHPRLQLMVTLAHYKAGFFSEARSMLERIRTATDGFRRDCDGRPDWLTAEGTMVEMVLLAHLTRPSPRIEALCATVTGVCGDDRVLLGACENVMMLVSQERGDLDAANASIRKTRRAYEAVGLMRYGKLQIIGHEILAALASGDLRGATELIAGYQKQPALECEDDLSIPSMLKLALAAIRYEREFDDESADALAKALAEHGPSESWFEQYAVAYPCILMRLSQSRGAEAVFDFITKARVLSEHVGIESLPLFLNALEVEYLVRYGELNRAVDLATVAFPPQMVTDFSTARPLLAWRERDALAHAVILLRLAQGKTTDAIACARQLVGDGESGGRLRTRIKGLVLLAASYQASHDLSAAHDALLRAVLYSYPQGFVAPFAEEGPRLFSLLNTLEREDACDTFACRHIATIRNAITGKASRKSTELNARELEIMRYVGDGAANKVIARRLGITENTVKFHLKKIFSKLDVSTRKAAVAKLSALRIASAPSHRTDARVVSPLRI